MRNEIRFGTDGWRGVISRDFTFENVRWVSQAVIDYLKKEKLDKKGLVIGHDRRFLSGDYAREVASVAAANGVKVVAGRDYVPTPAVSWAVRESGAGGGIMVTASHNPPQYNGLKFKEAFGGSALPETTDRLEKMLHERQERGEEPLFESFHEAAAKGNIVEKDLLENYMAAVRNFVDLDKIRGSGIRVAYDSMHGAGGGIIGAILGEVGLEVTEIRGDENPGFGGISPEPIDRNLERLMTMVEEENYDIGLATDGDADRIGAVDGHGRFFNSHRILTVLARHLVEERGMKGRIVKTVSGTAMIDHMAGKYGLEVVEMPIGFKHICKEMLKGGVLVGGEESGGIGITSHLPERDGILAGLMLVEIMAVKGKGIYDVLDEVFKEFGPFHYDRIDVEIRKEEMAKVRALLEKYHPQRIAGMKVTGQNRLDGVKFLMGDKSWLLIRASGTEPVLRIYAESDSPENVKKLLSEGKEAAELTD